MNDSRNLKQIEVLTLSRRHAIFRWLLLAGIHGCETRSKSIPDWTRNRLQELIRRTDRSRAALQDQIRSFTPDERSALAVAALSRVMEMTGADSDDEAGALLELVRAIKASGISLPLTPMIQLLSARSQLYQRRPKPEIVRLRSYMLLTAAAVGCGSDIAGLVIENLSNGMTAYSLACAARAARFIPLHAAIPIAMEPHLMGIHTDAIMSLDRYRQVFPESEWTSAHLEILRTVGHYGPAAKQLRNSMQACIDRLQSLRIQMPLPVLSVAIESLNQIGP